MLVLVLVLGLGLAIVIVLDTRQPTWLIEEASSFWSESYRYFWRMLESQQSNPEHEYESEHEHEHERERCIAEA
jgi:hypothetical protein